MATSSLLHHSASPRPEATEGGTTRVTYEGVPLALWYVAGNNQRLVVSSADYASGYFRYETGELPNVKALLAWVASSAMLAADLPRLVEQQQAAQHKKATDLAEQRRRQEATSAKDAKVKLPSVVTLTKGLETLHLYTQVYTVGIYMAVYSGAGCIAQLSSPSRRAARDRIKKWTKKLVADGYQLLTEFP